MDRRIIIGLGTILSAWALIGIEPAEAQSCQQYYDRASAAMTSSRTDLGALDALRTQVNASAQCGEVQKTCFNTLVADAYARRAGDLSASASGRGRDATDAEQLAFRAASIARTWVVLWTLADLAQRRKNYDQAALHYKSALTELSDVSNRIETYEQTGKSYVCAGEKEDFPAAAQREQLAALSSQADALSKSFVPAPPTRDGSFGGIFAGASRGLLVNRFPIPVEFEFDSIQLTQKGKDAAAFLTEYIRKTAPDKVVLTGHADRKGSDEYNCELSKRRLEALIEQIKRGAPRSTTFVAIPQGKSEPFPIVDGSEFTSDEVDQINRRIELRDHTAEVIRKCR